MKTLLDTEFISLLSTTHFYAWRKMIFLSSFPDAAIMNGHDGVSHQAGKFLGVTF